jgi:lysophospholipase L1-like esterase
MELALRTVYEPPPVWIQPQTRHLESPLLGWVLPPSTQSFTIDKPVSVNSLGLRDDEIPLKKPDGETRILCLGDSFTFALGVGFEELYVQKLETILNRRHPDRRFQVINAGVAGYNTRQELIYLLTQGLQLEPDLITIGFYFNDLIGNDAPLPDLALPRHSPRGNLHDREPKKAIPKSVRDLLRSSVLLYRTVTGLKAFRASLGPPPTAYHELQRALLSGDINSVEPRWLETEGRLSELAEVGRSHGIPILLMGFPGEMQIRLLPESSWGNRLAQAAERAQLLLVDLEFDYRDALAAGENPYLPYDLHPSAHGMKIAAERLYEAILEGDYLHLDSR